MPLDPTIPHQNITRQIIGAAMHVHNKVGPGYQEKHYQRALTAEMRAIGLGVEDEKPVDLYVDDNWIGRIYLDHLVEGVVVVEDKSFPHLLTNEEVAQVITYLAATDLKVGLLFNFGRKRLNWQRILQPKAVAGWPDRIQRYLWKPEEVS
jgi:GxxExxY protein